MKEKLLIALITIPASLTIAFYFFWMFYGSAAHLYRKLGKKKLFILLSFLMFLSSCVNLTLLPKAPYPYSFHEENKTCEYWIYHKHWENK